MRLTSRPIRRSRSAISDARFWPSSSADRDRASTSSPIMSASRSIATPSSRRSCRVDTIIRMRTPSRTVTPFSHEQSALWARQPSRRSVRSRFVVTIGDLQWPHLKRLKSGDRPVPAPPRRRPSCARLKSLPRSLVYSWTWSKTSRETAPASTYRGDRRTRIRVRLRQGAPVRTRRVRSTAATCPCRRCASLKAKPTQCSCSGSGTIVFSSFTRRNPTGHFPSQWPFRRASSSPRFTFRRRRVMK